MNNAPRTFRSPLVTLRHGLVPDSVGIEFERSRLTLEKLLSPQATDRLVESLVDLRVMGADAALLGAIVRRLSSLAPRLSGPGGLESWLTAVREVAVRARHCTLALLESSEEVLRHGSPAELLLWTRLGLRYGQTSAVTETDATLAHFELRSRDSARMVSPHAERVDLATSKNSIAHLLRALFDIAPQVLPVEQGLATRRPFLSNLGLHIPEVGRALRGSLARRWYEAAAAHAAAHLVHSTHKFERGGLKPIQTALVGLLEDARVELLTIQELPGLRRLWLRYHSAEPEHGSTFLVLMLRLARSLLDPTYEDPHPWVAKGKRLFLEATRSGSAPGQLQPASLRDMASRLGNDIGQMRLQFNAREYVVEPAYRDDNTHLWVDEDEAQVHLVSSTDPSPLPPDDAEPQAVRPPEDVQPALVARVQYHEWDRLVGDYRSAWATVVEGRPMDRAVDHLRSVVDSHAMLLQRLQRVLRAGRLRERVKLRGQLRGDELDIDAAVRSQIDRRLHHSPNEKVQQRQARRERDLAALVLIDGSQSTADAVASGGSVLDLARSAALLTTLTLVDAGDRCAIDAFCSNGRHEVRYDLAVDFGETVDDAALARLAGVRSQWSTRMGAALRHATSRLAGQPHRRRLLLFITDGEPHDIDIHDRRYLIEDARRAVFEAARHGVSAFCVTLDSAADGYVRTIFGSGNYRVLDRIDSLPRVLPSMVMQLTR